MQLILGVLMAILVVVGLTVALSVVAPFVVGTGFALAALVLINPSGHGDRLRQSLAWWRFPGMRRASASGIGFAAMLLVYAVPAPMLSYAMVHSSPQPTTGVSGPSSTSISKTLSPTRSAAITPTALRTAAPTAVATPPPTAVPPTQAPVAVTPPPPVPTPVVSQPQSTDPYAAAKTAGATAVCADGTLSFSTSRSGSCSRHGGVHWWTGNLGPAGPGTH